MSIRFQADADFNFDIVRAVRQLEAAIDFASATDAGLRGAGDAEVLARAAAANRVIVSHDPQSLPESARGRQIHSRTVSRVSVGAIGAVVESIILLWLYAVPLSCAIRSIICRR